MSRVLRGRRGSFARPSSVGSRRVEVHKKPIVLPTSAMAGLSQGDRQKRKNPALDFTVLVWDGDTLERLTPSAAYQGAFNQYQARVMIEFDIDIPDKRIITQA